MNNTSLEYLPTGNYFVDKKANRSVKALLGSCVGLAIFDKKNNVGGLYHILLPTFVNGYPGSDPKMFADTGVDLFLSELLEAGAEPNNLTAVIAGGAFIGPVSQNDLEMDIGGRNVETVLKILKRNNITVVESETGGYFSCSLTLHLNNWEYEISPIGKSISKPESSSKKLSITEIEGAISKVRPIPQIALKVIRMINLDYYNIDDIAKEIRSEEVISARVISLSNSASVNPRGNIDSLDRAIVSLGNKKLLQVVLNSSLELFFQNLAQGYSLCKGGLFHHALSAALLSESLAQFTGKVNPGLAYTAGLIHDIGKNVLDQFFADVRPYFYRQMMESGINLIEVEKSIFGYDHSEIGALLAERWNLPSTLKDVIAYHHKPETAAAAREVTHLVYLVDLILSRFHTGQEMDRIDTDNFKERLEVLGLQETQFPEIIQSLPWEEIA